jgi:hypothetical protein
VQNALPFLYRQIFNVRLPWLDDIVRGKRPPHLPLVLTRDSSGRSRLIASLLCRAGLRLL